MPDRSCDCMQLPWRYTRFHSKRLGVDETKGRFADVSIDSCKTCGCKWLHYYVAFEAFPESGRWYRAPISETDAARMKPELAVAYLEKAAWHFYGGSYFKTTGKSDSGRIFVDV